MKNSKEKGVRSDDYPLLVTIIWLTISRGDRGVASRRRSRWLQAGTVTKPAGFPSH